MKTKSLWLFHDHLELLVKETFVVPPYWQYALVFKSSSSINFLQCMQRLWDLPEWNLSSGNYPGPCTIRIIFKQCSYLLLLKRPDEILVTDKENLVGIGMFQLYSSERKMWIHTRVLTTGAQVLKSYYSNSRKNLCSLSWNWSILRAEYFLVIFPHPYSIIFSYFIQLFNLPKHCSSSSWT